MRYQHAHHWLEQPAGVPPHRTVYRYHITVLGLARLAWHAKAPVRVVLRVWKVWMTDEWTAHHRSIYSSDFTPAVPMQQPALCASSAHLLCVQPPVLGHIVKGIVHEATAAAVVLLMVAGYKLWGRDRLV